ncbi:myosin heavy chain, non-muscle-like [Lineus longissimus]|uniref:myosin heavy chain, non-muscle-like n=1 Tax=Lineus longissimus TaxID=88925 RepID=UPI00315CF63B
MKRLGRALGMGKRPIDGHSHKPEPADSYTEHESREEKRKLLRKARKDVISGIESDIEDITERHEQASKNVNKFQADFNEMENKVYCLGHIKACARQIESIKTGVNCPALIPVDTTNEFLKLERQRLREIQFEKKALQQEVKMAGEKLQDMTDLYNIVLSTKSVPPRVAVAVRGRKSNATACVEQTEKALSTLIEDEKQAKQKIGIDPCTDVATIDETDIIADLKTGREDPIARKQLLKELNIQAQQEMTSLKTKKKQISEELTTAKTKESKVREERERLEKKMEDLQRMDREQHARTMILIQGSLIDEEVKELKSTLYQLKQITRNMTQPTIGFTEIWDYLESQNLISVGDYYELRKSLLMRSKKELVSSIEEMEDKLLAKYDNEEGKTLSQPPNEPDAPAELLQTYSQTVDRKVKDKVYDQPGGPCRYLQDVMVLIKVYLQNLSTNEKTKSSEALYAYVDHKLKSQDIDIMVIEDKNTSDLKNSKDKISELEGKIKQLERDKQDVITAKDDLRSTHDQEKGKLNKELATANAEIETKRRKVRSLEIEKQAAVVTNAKTTEEAKIECNKLRAEKENTYQMYKGLLENIDGTRRAIRGEYNQLELKKDECRAEEVEEYRKMLWKMRENYEQVLWRRRNDHVKEIAEADKMLDVFNSRLKEVIMRNAEDDSRAKLEQRLFDLEKEYTMSLAEWDEERTTLKCELVEANIDKKIAEFQLKKQLQYYKTE